MQGINHLHHRINRFWVMLGAAAALLTLVIVPSVLPAQAQTQQTVYAAYQSYDGGYMIWQSDVGAIWAFYSDGSYNYFPLSTYSSLPANPMTDQTPDGHVRPVNGFGRVWGNYADVRARLGWPIIAEIGYDANISRVQVNTSTYPYTAEEFRITVPDGGTISVLNGRWQFGVSQPQPPIVPTPTYTPPPNWYLETIPATMQNYENGFMMWWSTNSSILVFNYDGTVQHFTVSSYASLPDNPFTLAPPWGYTRPIMGFGKVWGNHSHIRNRLGWATGSEYSNVLNYEQLYTQGGSGNVFALQISSTTTIIVRNYSTWSYG